MPKKDVIQCTFLACGDFTRASVFCWPSVLAIRISREYFQKDSPFYFFLTKSPKTREHLI